MLKSVKVVHKMEHYEIVKNGIILFTADNMSEVEELLEELKAEQQAKKLNMDYN